MLSNYAKMTVDKKPLIVIMGPKNWRKNAMDWKKNEEKINGYFGCEKRIKIIVSAHK